MEGYPFGHHNIHHHHHNPRDEEEEYPPPAPPPSFRDDGPPPPPPPSYYDGAYDPPPHAHHSGSGGSSYDAPPITDYHSQPPPPLPSQNFNYSSSGHGYPSQQPPADRTEYTPAVHHEPPVDESEGHSYRPHLPSFFHHNEHQQGSAAGKPAVRVFTKAQTNYSLTIHDGKVILAPSNPSDPFQHWIKDEKYSTKVKDEEGFPSFSLVNKATGQAMKHSIGATYPVQLIPYNPDVLDESILWTESKDLGDGYRTIRMVNNIRLNVDAFNGDKKHGGVREGTTIVLWEWLKGENQRWKIVPY